jgi:ribosome-associated protein
VTPKGISVGNWVIPESEFEERFDTSGGPGGQHANRSETAVTIRFRVGKSSLPDPAKRRLIQRVGEIVEATASESRSQWRNRALARRRLADKLESALSDATVRMRTGPSRRSRDRRLAAKRAQSEKKRRRRRPDLDT